MCARILAPSAHAWGCFETWKVNTDESIAFMATDSCTWVVGIRGAGTIESIQNSACMTQNSRQSASADRHLRCCWRPVGDDA